MNAEEQYLMTLCRAGYLGQAPCAPPPDLQWEALMELAVRHAVYGLAAEGALLLPDEVLSAQARRLAVRYQALSRFTETQQTAAAAELVGELSARGVDYCLLKGARWKSFYSQPSLRSMSDVDVLIRLTDWGTACRVLTDMGYRQISDIDLHGSFQRDSVKIELHRELLSTRDERPTHLTNVWPRMTQVSVHEYRLSETDEYLYFFTHAERHINNYVFVLRTLVDVAVLQARLAPDRTRLLRLAEETGIRAYVDNMETLSSAWLSGRLLTAGEVRLLDYLMGIGHMSRDEIWYRDNLRWLRMNLRPRRIFRQLFPSRDALSSFAGRTPARAFFAHFAKTLRAYGRNLLTFFHTLRVLPAHRRRAIKSDCALLYLPLTDEKAETP